MQVIFSGRYFLPDTTADPQIFAFGLTVDVGDVCAEQMFFYLMRHFSPYMENTHIMEYR